MLKQLAGANTPNENQGFIFPISFDYFGFYCLFIKDQLNQLLKTQMPWISPEKIYIDSCGVELKNHDF